MKCDKYVLYLILLEIAIFAVGVGISVGIFFNLKEQNAQQVFNSFPTLENQFGLFLEENINVYSYTNNITESLNRINKISDNPLIDFINFMDLNSNYFNISNELKYVPLVESSDRTYFENNASIFVKNDFEIYDVIFDGSPKFIPAANRSFYCPLSYIAPNKTSELFDFVGVDLCNSPPWKNMFERLQLSDNAVSSRLVVRTNTYVLDIGKNVYVGGILTGFAIHSFFLSDFVNEKMNLIYQKYTNEFITIQILENQSVLYQDLLYPNISSPYTSNLTLRFDSNIVLEINFKYAYEYIDLFNTDNSPEITLSIIILLFFIINVLLIIFFLVYSRKKQIIELDKLQRQNSYISKMINYVNHEIRNPLNSILGMLDITLTDMKKKEEDGPLISNLNVAYNSCILIDHIINDVLDIKKLEESKLDIYLEDINLIQFFEDLEKLLLPKIQEHININFSINCRAKQIHTDKSRLTQVLLNLISNSFKFTEEGSIRIEVFNFQKTVMFEIIDTGCGISEKNAELLFKPFSQLRENAVSRQVGYGLGLYLCKMLIELMDGEIGYRKNVEKGSIFWISLPNES